ncbi:MAG: phosphate/phosphite/phosphonate ABC transporter substrate-binding protein [Alphaproteobacteria bacterium]
MAVASLPMYDLPEVRGALDELWTAIAGNLRQAGVDGVPEELVHDRPLAKLWSDPELLLSQACGFDLVKSYTRKLRPVATPRYSAPGCNACRYTSAVIVSENSTATALEDLRGAVCAVNGPESHSGMNAFRALVAPLVHNGRFFSRVIETGAHSDSVALVASGDAGVAAIDCVSYALLVRYRPAAVAGTRVLCHTEPAPAIPYVTQADADEELVARLQTALAAAFADPGLAAARESLFLAGIEVLPHAAYYDLVDFEKRAVAYGYPKLR